MKSVFLICLVLCSVWVQGQSPSKFYTKFGGTGIDIGYSVKETYNKQYVIIGSTTSFGTGNADAYLLLSDSLGQFVWGKNLGGGMADVGKSIVINPVDSGFVFTGYTSSFGNGGFDVYVARTDKEGNIKWQAGFGGVDWDFGNDLILAGDGNIIICGSTYSYLNKKKDGILMKINIQNGAMLWQKNYGGTEDDEFRVLRATSDGYFSIGGNTKSYGDLNNDFWLFKINSDGDSIASKNFGNTNKAEMCYDFIEDYNNNLVFCGSYDTSFYNIGKNISSIIKTDINGGFIDEKKFGGATTPDDKLLSITNKSSGNKYFLSRKVNNGLLGIDIQPFLFGYTYNVEGTTTYGGLKEDEAFETINTSDNGLMMVGYSKGGDDYSEDVLLIKLDSTLLNTPSVVGIKENRISSINRKIYFHDNIVYFENENKEKLYFQIVNSNGVIAERGITEENSIKLNPNLPNGIYFVQMSGTYNLQMKFIKN